MLKDLKNDPLLENIRKEPEFMQVYSEMESKFQTANDNVGKWLKEKGIQ